MNAIRALARAVAQEEAAARARGQALLVALAGVGHEFELEVAEAALGHDVGHVLGDVEFIRHGRRRDRRERAVLDRVARVRAHALDLEF